MTGSASSIIEHLTRPGSGVFGSRSSGTSTLVSPQGSSSSTSSSSSRGNASSPTPLLLHQHHRGPTTITSGTLTGTKFTGSGRASKLANGSQAAAATANQHVVHVHVNPGEVFSVRLDDQIQHIEGRCL